MKQRPLLIAARLAKIKITLMVTLSAGLGFVLACPTWNWQQFLLLGGVFFLASGSAALNQYQERAYDAQMDRTKHRPIPSGQITPPVALRLAVAWMTLGACLLGLISGLALLLGIFLLFWYNGVYTRLKRATAWAAVPGGLIGAIPPVMGWVAAGGGVGELKIWSVAAFFFIWQIPHFWLLAMIYSQDYAQAGFPCLSQRFSTRQIAWLICGCLTLTIAMSLYLPMVWEIERPVIGLAFVASTLWLAAVCLGILHQNSTPMLRFAFIHVNLYAFWIMALLAGYRLTSL